MCGEYQPSRTARVRHAAPRWPPRCSTSPRRASACCSAAAPLAGRGGRASTTRSAASWRRTCVAAHDVPGLRNSAMDGFAVRSGKAGPRPARRRRVARRRARPTSRSATARRSASRPAAMLPEGADAVAPAGARRGPTASASRCSTRSTPGRNVREAGEDLRAGRPRAARRHAGWARPSWASRSTPGARACAAPGARGSPSLATGDELLPPGEPLGPGQIHDSNRVTLAALARRDGARGRVRARTSPRPRGGDARGDRRGAGERRRRDPVGRRVGRPARSRQARARRARRARSASGAWRCGRASRRGSARAGARSSSGCRATPCRRW